MRDSHRLLVGSVQQSYPELQIPKPIRQRDAPVIPQRKSSKKYTGALKVPKVDTRSMIAQASDGDLHSTHAQASNA